LSISVADLAAVDNLQSSAWDYSCVRQLHYCMLIIASYLRQRNHHGSGASGNTAVENAVGNSVPYASLDEDLGINTLQVRLFTVDLYLCLQCFDAVNWAAGKASGL